MSVGDARFFVTEYDIRQWQQESDPSEMTFLATAAKRQKSEVKMTELTNAEKKEFSQAKHTEVQNWLKTGTVSYLIWCYLQKSSKYLPHKKNAQILPFDATHTGSSLFIGWAVPL